MRKYLKLIYLNLEDFIISYLFSLFSNFFPDEWNFISTLLRGWSGSLPEEK